MDIHEIVKKLVGEIEPVGETNIDNARFENLKVMAELIGKLIFDIDELIPLKDRAEYSINRAGKYADRIFDDLGITE